MNKATGLYTSSKQLRLPISIAENAVILEHPVIYRGVLATCSVIDGLKVYKEEDYELIVEDRSENTPYDTFVCEQNGSLYAIRQGSSSVIEYNTVTEKLSETEFTISSYFGLSVVVSEKIILKLEDSVNDDYIYHVVRLNADDFSLEWKTACSWGPGWNRIEDDKVFVVSKKQWVQCLDFYTGAVVWEREYTGVNEHDTFWYAPAVFGAVLVVFLKSKILGIDAGDGSLLWEKKCRLANGIVSEEGKLYTFDYEQQPIGFQIVDVETGEVVKEFPLEIEVQEMTSAFYLNGISDYELSATHLWVMSKEYLVAINLETGVIDWWQAMKYRASGHNFLLANNRLYIKTEKSDLFEPDRCYYVVEGDGGYVEDQGSC